MTHKSAAIVEHSIGLVLLTWGFFTIKKKIAEQPDRKLYGFSWEKIRLILFIGMGAFVLLIIITLMGLD